MKELKSIISLRPCMLISILVFLMTIIIFMNSVIADDEYKEIIQDLPTASDFDSYLNALELALEFCIAHRYYVDMNLQFGLFLMDVNLRHVLHRTRTGISANIRSRLEILFMKNDEVNKYFHFMIHKNRDALKSGPLLKLIRLFYNATTWTNPVDRFNLDLLNQTTIYSPEQLKKIYGRWETYYTNVHNSKNTRPSPTESDKCISHMVQSPLPLNRRSQANCLTPPRCKQLLQSGSEFGYGLTHRLLYLIVARFSRRCVVFSEKEDIFMTDMACRKCFGEAQFIASNSFQLPDLLFEHIALCGIFGHAQFLRNYWLKTLLHLQTSDGCFSLMLATGELSDRSKSQRENKTWLIEQQWNVMNGQCSVHFTAVAAATLSHALRFIIENHY